MPPMQQYDLLDWTSFDAAIEIGYRTTMEALDKARSLADRRAHLHRLRARNFRLLTTLSIVLRGPCTPMPTKSSASTGAAAKAVRLSASLVGLEHRLDIDGRHQLARQGALVGAAQFLDRAAIDEHRLADQRGVGLAAPSL